VQASLAKGIDEENLKLIEKMPRVPLAKYAYRNNGDLTFTDMASSWGIAQPGFSNGAVYADLNNTGALDLVVNNVNAPASIYRSHARADTSNHFLTLVLRGAGANTAGIGAKVTIRHGGKTQMVEQMPTRGFQSSVDPRPHFGLGNSTQIDSLIVVWPDHRFQVLTNIPVDRLLTLSQQDAAGRYTYGSPVPVRQIFSDVTSTVGIDFRHEENDFFDFSREPLMPHLLSTEGPALAVGDVNGDGLDDMYVGGAKWQAGRLFIQSASGRFRSASEGVFQADSLAEDVDAIFFDADSDGDQDLYVVSGGNEFSGSDEALRDRLYINDGGGNFQRARTALPDFFGNGSCVTAGDFDADGDLDLFVGARVVSRSYGATPASHLLENDGHGRFTDVTALKSDVLADAGMVSSAVWLDYDNDRQLDLIVVGEWMPVLVFRQQNGRFVDRTEEAGLSGTNGWWNSVTLADLNRDGRQDLVLGNLGLNSYIRASRDEPARLYVRDFYDNGSVEQLLTFYKHGASYPLAGKDEIVRLMPQLRSKYVAYSSFGASRIEDILPATELSKAQQLEARVLANSIAMNNGKGGFTLSPLPAEAQFAPVYAALADDFDRDGQVDLLLGGNFFGVTPVRGRYDASYGLLLRGVGNSRFVAVGMDESNLAIEGQVRSIGVLRRAGGDRLIVVARNDDKLVFLRAIKPPTD